MFIGFLSPLLIILNYLLSKLLLKLLLNSLYLLYFLFKPLVFLLDYKIVLYLLNLIRREEYSLTRLNIKYLY